MAKTNEKKYQRANIEQGAANSKSAFSNFAAPIIKRAPGERENVISGYQNFAKTGGLSDEEYQQMRDSYTNNLGGGASGSLSDFSKERAGYGNFADTGGYTGADIQRTRSQAARSAPAMFSAMKDQYNLNRSNLGANANAGAGFDFKAMRAGAQQSAQDKTSANIGLTEAINAGKLSGLGGLTNIDTITGDQSMQNAQIMNAYNLAKSQGMSDIEARIAALKQGGRQYGQTGLANFAATDQNDWLRAIGAGDESQQGWQGLSLQNDQVNKSGIWGNVGKGLATAGSWLKNLFNGKNKDGNGANTTNKYFGADPNNSDFGDPPEKDADQLGYDMRLRYESTKRPGESFSTWEKRVGNR